MTPVSLQERTARSIAAVLNRSSGDAPKDPKHPILAHHRKLAEDAAEAALASIRPGDRFGDGLIAVRRGAAPGPANGNDDSGARPR